MRRECTEWPDPPFSPFRKPNVGTAWPRLVRASHLFCHTFLMSAAFIRRCLTWFCFCVVANSKWVGSDSREKRDLQHGPQHWTLDSHPNRTQWVQHTVCLSFTCLSILYIYIQLSLLFVSLTRLQRWKQDTTEGETWRDFLLTSHLHVRSYKLL